MYEFAESTLTCITPLHVGCGQDTGIIDLPLVREKTTGFPFVPGTGQRGAMRARIEPDAPDETRRLLGLDERAGCISVIDARLLLFPVRSSPGIFRWVTCPFVLHRYARDRQYFCGDAPVGLDRCCIADGGVFAGHDSDRLVLEEFPLDKADDWTLPLEVEGVDPELVALVSDEWFRYFVTHATFVQQHVRLTGQKTARSGQLFSVESAPPETVFYSFVGATHERVAGRTGWQAAESRRAFLDLLTDKKTSTTTLTLGGNESTGLGITRIVWRLPERKVDVAA